MVANFITMQYISCQDVANSRFSMRSLRSSLASSSLTTSRAVRQSEAMTAYTSVPRQRLNLVDVQVG